MTAIAAERTRPYEVQREHKPFCIFIGGATSSYKGLGGIDSVLKVRFGEERVRVFNSSLFSSEKPSINRFKEMGDLLKDNLTKGPVTVIGHSFAVAEVYAAMNEIEKDEPEFFKDETHLMNLQLVLISPTLPRNMREGFLTGARFAKVGVQEAGVLGGRTLPGKTSILHGIVSTDILPPEGIDSEALTRRIGQTAFKISHRKDADEEIAIVDFTPQRRYQPELKRVEQDIVRVADNDFLDGTAHGNLAKALRQRGRRTHAVLEHINKSDWPDLGDIEMEGTNYEKDKQASKMIRRLVKDTFFTGKVYDKMTQLSNAGAAITIVWPEFDLMLSRKQVQRLRRDTNMDAIIASNVTHGFPWADQPEFLLTLLDQI